MNINVKSALYAAISQYSALQKQPESPIYDDLVKVFGKEAGFMDKLADFDEVFDQHPKFEELREPFFDLLMVNFFTSDVTRLEADYLDSKEWEQIEDQTIDRGTELLNLLLYIKECHDEDIQPGLEDFLKEFLLVEEDEFQDEYHIYEALIANQQLAECSAQEICENAKILKLNDEMKELFVPFMCFFAQLHPEKTFLADIAKYSNNSAFDTAIYSLIATFNESI